MEAQEITTTSLPRMSADRHAWAASICILTGASLFALLWLLNALILDRYSHIAEDPVAAGGCFAFGLVYLVGPVFGILACIRLWRDRHNRVVFAGDAAVRHRAGQRFGRAATLFALTGLLAVYVVQRSGEMLGPPVIAYTLHVWSLIPPLLAMVLGIASLRRPVACRGRVFRRGFAMIAVAVGLVAAVGPLAMTRGVYLIDTIRYGSKSPTFSGSSDLLTRTVVVPTLDSPCPPNKNVIWCSSFQLAWNEIQDTIVGAPVQIVGAEDLAARLNAAGPSKMDIEPNSYYATAGRVKDGVAGRIHKEMALEFPSEDVPDLADAGLDPEGVLAYSFLTASVPFRHPFHVHKADFPFTDSQGVQTSVRAFGAWGSLTPQDEEISEQVKILYFYPFPDMNDPAGQMTEFAVDLCRYSEPYQVVAAVVEPRESLAQTLNHVQAQIARFQADPCCAQEMTDLGRLETMVVPEMFWELDHRFTELVGRTIANANPPAPVADARQTVRFKLDRFGAVLTSYAVIYVSAAGVPRQYRFDRPFLLYMKKRGCEHPFFVMWVDNAELLTPR